MINQSEEARLIEVGRLTARLLHDFKNQMGGMKLYAAYLKKRFAGHSGLSAEMQTEASEIVAKIMQGLDDMAANATLVGKLAQPIVLRVGPEEIESIVAQVLDGLRSRAEARNVRIEADIATVLPMLTLDWQQMREALDSLITRAIEVSPDGGTVRLHLQFIANALQLEIEDQANVSEEARQALFEVLSNERLNKVQLKLAMARCVIEAHGGQFSVVASQEQGTRVCVMFPM